MEGSFEKTFLECQERCLPPLSWHVTVGSQAEAVEGAKFSYPRIFLLSAVRTQAEEWMSQAFLTFLKPLEVCTSPAED